MTHDDARNRVVLFGGESADAAPFADTWEWDGSHWTQVADTGPSARRGAAMAYAAADARAVLFGGRSVPGRLDDTWTFDGSDWIQVADTGPSPRADHAMAYDPVRGKLVLFGGRDQASLGDTWEWDGSAWVQVEDTGPAARHGHVLAYDGASGKVVLFGGGGGPSLGDTWSWDGSHWTQVADTGPAVRIGAAVSGGGSVLLFGGVSSLDLNLAPADRLNYGDTWRWSNGAWVQVQDIGPGPRWGHQMAFRRDAGRAVLFGGWQDVGNTGGELRSDTWEIPDQAGTPTPNPGTQPGAGVYVVGVSIVPNQVLAGQPVNVQVGLSGPAAAGSALTIEVTSVVMPSHPPSPWPGGWAIPSVTFNGGETTAQFTLVPDGSVPIYGGYAVAVQLTLVTVPQYATFVIL